jgi:hypothetical protein
MPVLIWWATLLHQRVRTGRPATVSATSTSTGACGVPAPRHDPDHDPDHDPGLGADLGALAYEESSNR